jgi:glycosyltransferase involved in cell wall biosynthesis
MTKHACMIAYTNYSTDARVRREAETLAETGEFHVTFLSLMEGETARSYVLDGVHVRELCIRKYRGKNRIRYILSYLMFLAFSFLVCAGRAASGKLDVAHVHNMPNFIVFAAIPAKCFGKKVILDIHDSVPETYLAKFSTGSPGILYGILCMEERICCAIADRIICVNHPQREALVRRGIPAGKIVVSMNVPDPRLFPQSAGKADGPGDTTRLVYHGTITRRLGIDLAIRAVARISESNPDLRFVILGEGDDAGEFAALIQSLHAGETIRFENRMIPVEDLKSFLADMDIGIVANRKNIATDLMLPVKMLEYIALGIPVAAPRLKTIAWYFTDDMISFFEPENVDSLAGAIEALVRSPERRREQNRNAKAFFAEYGWERQKHDLLNLYRRMA